MPPCLGMPQQEEWDGWGTVSWPTHVLGTQFPAWEKSWAEGRGGKAVPGDGQLKAIMEVLKFYDPSV